MKNDKELKMKKLFSIYTGGGYAIQPHHKSNMLPDDYLIAFCNVQNQNLNEVVDFCNNYQANPTWILKNQSLTEGFQKIQDIFKPIIEKVLYKENLLYREITIINKYLSNVKLRISIRKEPLETTEFEENFELYVPDDNNYKIQFHGSPEKDVKESFIEIVFEESPGKNLGYKIIKNGLWEIEKYFNDEKLEHYSAYKDDLVNEITLHYEQDGLNPTSIEQKIYVKKTNLSFDELDAAYACSTLESQLAQLIWDRLNNKRESEIIRRCASCGHLYRKGKDSRSANYCSNLKCKNEYKNRQTKIRYKNDPLFRETKIKQAELNKHKPK